MVQLKQAGARSAYFLVWSWNAIYAIVAVTLLIPEIVMPAWRDAFINAAPWSIAVIALLIVVLPLFYMALACTLFRRDPIALLKLFYGVEVPIFFLLLCRVTLFRDPNPGLIHLLVNVSAALLIYFLLVWFRHFRRPAGGSGPVFSLLSVGAAVIPLLVGLYLAALMLPFAIPLGALFVQELWDALFRYWSEILRIFREPLVLVSMLLTVYTATLFVALPFVSVGLYIKSFLDEWRGAVAASGVVKPLIVVLCIVLLDIGLFVNFNRQTHHLVLQSLEDIEQNPEVQLELLDRDDEIRQGLIDTYLAAYRYVSAREKSNAVTFVYKEAFGAGDTFAARVSQDLFNSLALPFLYVGKDFTGDAEKAAHYYQLFFDTPIEKAERARIAHAAEVTWQRERAAAGLLNTLSEFVLITEQHITVEPRGDGARITIQQTLENQTFRQHEVLFHFSLPQEAALTGLWLSDDPNDFKKYAYVVSPRGAAQQVYNAEVRRRVDPSLLEQVGPRQYRLRAFPVLPRMREYKEGNWRGTGSFTVEPLYVRFEYQTICDDNGNWPLPELLEKRNVYWNESTRRVVNDHELTGPSYDWLPSVAAAAKVERRARRINLGDTVVSVVPRPSEAVAPDLSGNNHQPLAVLVDGSYSMTSQEELVASALARLRDQDINHELFLCHHECREIADDAASRVYYGNSQTLQQLAAWQTMAKPAAYRAVLVLTDAGSYELASDAEVTSGVLPPLWLVHLGDRLPYAYHDQLLGMLRQSGGGIAGTMEQAVASLSFWENRQGADPSLFAITEHYSWHVEPGAAGGASEALADGEADAFQQIAARQWLDYLARVEDTRTLPVLDRLHGLAKQYHLVTDYSSMIVLVNDRQRQALKEAEAKDDRFAREVETGGEDLSKPADMFSVSAVPEPGEVMLLGAVGMLLLGSYARRRYGANVGI